MEIIERYLTLSPAEEQEMDAIATPEEKYDLANFVSIYEEWGIEKGERRILLRQLRTKFGELPEAITARVNAMLEPELESLTDRILTFATLDELFPPSDHA